MKKKVMSLLLVAAMSVSMLAGCGSSDEGTADNNAAEGNTVEATEAAEEAADAVESTDGAELALVIDVGTIDDKSFNQGSWEGLKKYGDENGISYKYYKSAEATTDAFQETIALAIEGGAKVVVCPGYLFETPIYNMQTEYPDVKFILIDGEPHDADYADYTTTENTMAVLYQEDQAGFLAGYAAVKDGYTELGFMGGMALPAVIRYGYGYLAGAEYAAEEMGVDVTVNYTYTGAFEATPEAQSMATGWYQAGTQVIFGCGGAVGNSVMSAAEASDGKVIGVDVDQSSESDTVITSAMKMLSNSVYDAITAAYDGTFPGGATTTFNVTNDGVGIAMDTAKFENFTQEDYDAIYAKLVAGEIVIDNDTDKDVTELSFDHVTVNSVQ